MHAAIDIDDCACRLVYPHAQTLLEQAKQQAAFRAVDENVKSGDRVGVGSGSTVVYAVERLAEHQQARRLKNIVCVPSSFQAEQVLERSLLFVVSTTNTTYSRAASLLLSPVGAADRGARFDAQQPVHYTRVGHCN